MTSRIKSDPAVCGGDPCISGTRIPAHVVLSHLAAGESIDEVVENFPGITADDVRECIGYGAYLATEKAVAV